ncbi:bifunctional phosphoribosylaminoimidazolecarboxamide formyltransferase/IMP cyclohydrolase [Buchnera aphidicola (Muscaphis stroyani)]|uniref:Bifunctional purine biosynthesis protein PurH n=1 Tax=Buchnera aphidicola (Muscaphis stroyani) TaxID=1241869 RepID=A0A4D6YEY8_9GAMM|nr:bifunctional phosphoribosylaminoimidazolecarboxamide formyltransferase/IMP cyclohydrolase [Buchnera aphidicola]QCI24150.1 bifunctional phosphoribosylaminoimidazolecarboxamide formyltransferase/IMP cyclohydrolase [Buchnera aphidicola (Muscaphis stroyani)]
MNAINIIQNALISVYDKQNIVKISKNLVKNKISLFATEGTSKTLHKHNIPVTSISDYINFPEIMNGRVKTLHPKILAGILNRGNEDQLIMNFYNISSINMVIVNFYPFEKVQKNPKNKIDDIIENIDIGGPTLVRAAAKNYKNVIVIVDLLDVQSVINKVKNNSFTIENRLDLADKAFRYTLSYEKKISQYFFKKNVFNKKCINKNFPNEINLKFIKKQNLRYGENQHQKSSLYIEKNISSSTGTISCSNQLQGKVLSYNNISDAEVALECVKEFINPACVIVKHGNPCGVSESNSLLKSYLSAYRSDPVSAFGGIVAFNSVLDEKTAQEIVEKQFVEVLIAPKINSLALKILKKKSNIRVLISGKIKKCQIGLDFKKINYGLLLQEYDYDDMNYKKWKFVTKRFPTTQELKDAIFCWKVAKFVKSNAIVYGFNGTTISIGAGQMSRIYSTKIANIKAKDQKINITGSTMASDAFFPFRDGIDSAASIGIKCIIQPGGSKRDQEIIQAANEYNIAMIFTNKRHFRH